MKRILMVIPDHEYGGEENRSYRIYRGLVDCGMNVVFATEESGYQFDDGNIVKVKNLNKVWMLPVNIVKLYILIKKVDAEVILLFKRKSAFLGWALEKLMSRRKFVFNVANAWNDKKILWKFSPRYICTLSDRLVPEELRSTKEIKQIRIGVPMSYKLERSKALLTNRKIRLIAAGKLNRQKNYVRLVKIAGSLNEFGYEAIVDIAGDGPMRGEIEKAAEALGVSICLRGHVENMEDFYREGGVYVQASSFEGMPNALIEAGQCCIPVVANSVGATADLIDSETGWLINSDTTEEYVMALREIIENPAEAERRAKSLQDRVVHNYDVDTMNRAYFEYVSSL
ncbi:glycosyltransferase family 4 protein [Spongiibacter sp. KMU-166]|uniref:Glycosyltransferase family 4 protein n=1 Tax=Spongiibacter thalassae TaxID=2721624 RepID=A0ABX1GK43_9GAMM|nr:glycosyltransferase family 4 protein [Spongiibacter thalassae]NKI19558.1 glycosyltransferase family 4 protein [Spongiibacter thalassae]